MRSNQSENDASIYVALRFARRHLKVAQINLSHLNLPASSIESALPIRYTVITPLNETGDLFESVVAALCY